MSDRLPVASGLTALLLLLLLLQFPVQPAAADSACSPNYTLLNGTSTCLSPVSIDTAKICDALEACAQLGHRLLTPDTYARVRSRPEFAASWIHVGATDALRERNRSRDGWQVMPGLRDMTLTGDDWWASGEPGNQGIYGQNCLLHRHETNRLHDVECWSQARYHCEHPAGRCIGGTGGTGCPPMHNSGFQRADIPGYSQTGPGCSQLISVADYRQAAEVACALACRWRLGCVGFYSNSLRQQCVLLPHFDATVNLPYSNADEMTAWQKLVSSDLADWA